MRFLLNFRFRDMAFELDYRRVVLSFLKKAMSEDNDGKLHDKYFTNNHFRDYGFAVFFDMPVFNKDGIIVEGKRLQLLISADDREKTGQLLYEAVLKQKENEFMLPLDNSMILEDISFIDTAEITENRIAACFLTGGGLVLKEHKKNTSRIVYRTYQSPEFDRVFGLVIQNQLKTAGFDNTAAQSVRFTPLACRKSVVLHYNSLIDTTIGTFVLEGDKDALQYLYNAGIGSRNGFGFGLFNVVSQIKEI